ncbi:hypothetical protein GCM10009616_01570 [Microlunatus lacustris]
MTSRNQTIAVGGTNGNSCLAMAAPNWTETMPPTTSQTAGTRSRDQVGLGRLDTSALTGPPFHGEPTSPRQSERRISATLDWIAEV